MYKFQTKKDHIIHLTMSEDDAWDCSIPAQQVLLDLSVRDCTLLTFRIRSFVLFTVTEISPPPERITEKIKLYFFSVVYILGNGYQLFWRLGLTG